MINHFSSYDVMVIIFMDQLTQCHPVRNQNRNQTRQYRAPPSSASPPRTGERGERGGGREGGGVTHSVKCLKVYAIDHKRCPIDNLTSGVLIGILHTTYGGCLER